MAKQCLYEGCTNKTWGGGYCKWHQSSRRTKKRKDIYHDRIIITQREVESGTKHSFEEDKQFYYSIWETREHRCFNCGTSLPNEPLTLYFHHVLEKRNYPEFRHEEWNIIILCSDCHSQIETFPNKKVQKIINLTKELKEKYEL